MSSIIRRVALYHPIGKSLLSSNINRNFSGFRRLPQTPTPNCRNDLLNLSKRFPKQDLQCRLIHPIFILVGKQVAKLGAIVTGRAFRNWWRSLPTSKRQYFMQVLRDNRQKIAVGFGFVTSLSGVYYVSHIQETPITKRRRFIAFTKDQFNKLSEYEFQSQLEEFKGKLYPANHPYVKRVQAVATRLLTANKDIKEIYDKDWSVTVVHAPQQNAFVLPSGQIFVFSGMLGLCENDDQLGCVLGHEMAHAILGHGAELISYTHLVDSFMIIVLAAIWAILPNDGIAVVTHWFSNRVVELLLQLPYSRKLEIEADIVGLEISSKACFDIRESSAFWSKMSLYDELKDVGVPEFLSTHPAHETRSQMLDDHMKQALYLRVDAHCPPLPRKDPRLSVDLLKHQILAAKKFREIIAAQPNVVLIRPE